MVWADEGLDVLIPPYLVANDIKVKLFCNNHTPVRGDSVASFTEAAGGGYAAKTLGANTHTVDSGSTPHDISWSPQTFTFTGPLTTNTTIYGYFVTNSAGTKVLWAQLLDTPFVPANDGDNLQINPCKFQYSGGTPT